MGSPRRVAVLAVLAALVAVALPATAAATGKFHPRSGHAWGLIPHEGQQEIAAGSHQPVVYHGGSVMRNVTIHTIFWAPSGYSFDPAPSVLTQGYEATIQQFYIDAAHDSGSTTNMFSILDQYGDSSGPGSYNMHYTVAADSINDTDPFPAKSQQCASPAGIATCVTDLEVEKEIDRMISEHDPSGRDLSDDWIVFLPPDVDECTSPGVCATTEYAGYHSLGNVGNGRFIYVVVPDIQVEGIPGPGSYPGNPEAGSAIDTVSHETVESITNPEGNAWMDPNGFEVADDCENPEYGTPLGYSSDGSPYNEVINGHQYLIQMMWSDAIEGCVQRSTATTSALPLATVDLTQFSPHVTGNIGYAKGGVAVTVGLVRTGLPIASASTRTKSDGSWSITLHGKTPHAFGDDRDEVDVLYGAGGPKPDLIGTGDGGNPYTESGWTGWYDLDSGFAVGTNGVAVSPCSQTGGLTIKVGKTFTAPPIEQCETETDLAVVKTARITAGMPITMSSEDNRAASALNPNGALIKLTIPLGEPNSVGTLNNDDVPFLAGGFPFCTANLESQSVVCQGLVEGSRYAVTRRRGKVVRRGRANFVGFVRFAHFSIRGGDVLTLRNSAGRVLSTLHVAHLRVNIDGDQTVLASGTCEPGDYYGKPLSGPPLGDAVGYPGSTDTGNICPPNGRAKGLPVGAIEQTDDLSGGLTSTVVPELESMSPSSGATLYGPFVVAAQPVLPGLNDSSYGVRATVSLTIKRAGAKRRSVYIRNAAVGSGVRLRSLPAGSYDATWVVRDVNGDTRTVQSRFVEAG